MTTNSCAILRWQSGFLDPLSCKVALRKADAIGFPSRLTTTAVNEEHRRTCCFTWLRPGLPGSELQGTELPMTRMPFGITESLIDYA